MIPIIYNNNTRTFPSQWNAAVQEQYHQRYGADVPPTVQSNDVTFALHGLVLSFVWITQIYHYNQGRIHLSRSSLFFLGGILVLVGYASARVWISSERPTVSPQEFQWLDALYLLSMIKVVITITKYIPQVITNFSRKSTAGWTIWNVALDITGGTLSLLQLVLDSFAIGDWSGITGNFAKLGVAVVTILFDVSRINFIPSTYGSCFGFFWGPACHAVI